MKTKKGESDLSGNLISLIIGAAILFVLVVLFIALTDPFWNRGEQTAKSYWKQLDEKIKEANAGYTAEMEILPVSNQGVAVFIIYFNGELGGTFTDTNGIKHFFFNNAKKTTSLSVCYSEKDKDSKCIELESNIPSILTKGEEKWSLSEGQKFTIKREGDQYVFTKK